MPENQVRYDVDGYDVLTTAIRELVNQYPGLPTGDMISFSVLGEDRGKAMFPVSGAVIEQEAISVTGKVRQVCRYPFVVIYRAAALSEARKAAVKEWLDNLGRWLERQQITVDCTSYTLESYPALSGGREILSISRQTPAALDSVEENGAENWIISISARYRNIFYRKS